MGNIVILTGAGISKESGLSTFRDPDGIWAQVRIEDVATPQAFARNPARVHAFYNARRQQLTDPAIQPNAAHRALVRLEQGWRGDFLLVTQNVDDLHDRAGSQRLAHMHGELGKVRCVYCGHVWPCTQAISVATPCERCGKVGGVRPDIVWFNEMPMHLQRIDDALANCDLFVSIGTSGQVYPAAGFAERARLAGARTIELNLEPSDGYSLFDEAHYGPATQTVPAFVDQALAEWSTQPDKRVKL